MEDSEAQEGEPQEELASIETINTPAVIDTQIGKEKYCNFNQNYELLISIIHQMMMIISQISSAISMQKKRNERKSRCINS